MLMCLFRPDILAVIMRMCVENIIRFIGGNNAYVQSNMTHTQYYEQLHCLLSTYAVLHVCNIAFVHFIMYSSLHIWCSIGMYI